jgi:arginine/lysine/ornithine decarboxylase
MAAPRSDATGVFDQRLVAERARGDDVGSRPGRDAGDGAQRHKSSFAALVLSGARPVFVDPNYDEKLEIALGPLASDVAAVLDDHPEARGALIFTPSYYGTSADPDGALSQGSDLAIGSVHKTLSGLGQTSVLSVGSDRIDVERLQLCFELQKSTSMSTLLLSSLDGARQKFVADGEQLLGRAVRTARLIRGRPGRRGARAARHLRRRARGPARRERSRPDSHPDRDHDGRADRV